MAGSLKPMCTFELAQISVERSDRKMPVLSGDLHDEMVREPYRWPLAKALARCQDSVRVLNGHVRVVEEHVHGQGDPLGIELEHRLKHPRRFRQYDVRNPDAL